MNWSGLNINELLYPKEVSAVNIWIGKAGSLKIDAVLLKKSKSSLEIVSSSVYPDLDSTLEKLDQQTGLVLNFDGKGVIHRLLSYQPDEDQTSLMNRCLPNASLQDFYLQIRHFSPHEIWVSVIRREVLNQILEQFKSAGYYILNVHLGPFSLSQSLPISTTPKCTLIENKVQHIDLVENEVSSIQPSTSSSDINFTVDSNELSTGKMIALGNAIAFLVANDEFAAVQLDNNEDQLSELVHKSLFKKMSLGLLGFFLLVLLINFFAFDHYNSKYQQLNEQFTTREASLIKLKDLAEMKADMELFMLESGVRQSSLISYYADQVALTLPKDILLSSMRINPLEDNNEDEQIFEYNSLTIEGQTSKSLSLNSWIKEIQSSEWVSEVKIVDFNLHPRTGLNHFELKISIDDRKV